MRCISLPRYCYPMSNLTPQKRMNKLGHLVTKHVKADTDTKKAPLSLPAPSVVLSADRPKEQLDTKELLDVVGRNLQKANFNLSYSHLELLEGTKVQGPRRHLLEALVDATEGIDGRGANSLMSGVTTYRANKHDHNVACLQLAARAYEFCRKVDDATPYSEDDEDQHFFYDNLGNFAKESFGTDITDGSDPDDVTDLEGAYFLDRLGLDDESRFNSLGAYYRAMGKLKERREDLIDYMPLLITARMVDPGSNTTLNDIFELTDYLKGMCPVEKVPMISLEVLKRRIFNVDMVEELASSEATTLTEGVL